MTRAFTGRHMWAVMIGFFGVVIAVNVVMARFAIGTFSGTVVENSYVASQEYNRWLAEARAQAALGWKVAVSVDAARHVHIRADAAAGALPTADVRAIAAHPLGRIPDRALVFTDGGNGDHVSTMALPAGRFLIHIVIRSGGHEAHFNDNVPA